MSLLEYSLDSIMLSYPFGNIKRGALRAEFNYPPDKPLPAGWACANAKKPIGSTVRLGGTAKKMTTQLKRRIVFACNAGHWR